MVIVSPVNRSTEVNSLISAGAGELYLGYMPDSWVRKYGESDTISRRQGRVANVSSPDELAGIVSQCKGKNINVKLALNARYTADMLPDVLEAADLWDTLGGSVVIISDLGLLVALKRRKPHFIYHLSIMAVTLNSQAVDFFRRFGIARVVLSRILSLSEMSRIVGKCPGIEFEAIVLFDKCYFIDGFCSFYHGTSYYPCTGYELEYEYDEDKRAVKYISDPSYAGHGCKILPFIGAETAKAEIFRPHCGACSIKKLLDAGVKYLKIGGRGFPADLKIAALKFIAESLKAGDDGLQAAAIYGLHEKYFSYPCDNTLCYYPEG